MKNSLAESIRGRLLNLAKTEQSDFNTVLTKFALLVQITFSWINPSIK